MFCIVREYIWKYRVVHSFETYVCIPVWHSRRAEIGLKAVTHEVACSRSTLLQHAPAAKLPRLHQRFVATKYVAQQNVCSRVLLPHIKLVWYEVASSRGKSVARFCFRSKLPRVYWNLLCGSVFQGQAPSCVLKFALRERVSGASSLVCTEICFAGACFRSKLPLVYRPLKPCVVCHFCRVGCRAPLKASASHNTCGSWWLGTARQFSDGMLWEGGSAFAVRCARKCTWKKDNKSKWHTRTPIHGLAST